MFPPKALTHPSSTKLVRVLIWVEHCPFSCILDPLVFDELVVDPYVLALNRQGCLGCLGVDNEVVVAVGAIFVAFLELLDVFAKTLPALLAGKDHLESLEEGVFFLFAMAFGTIEPLLACCWSVYV